MPRPRKHPIAPAMPRSTRRLRHSSVDAAARAVAADRATPEPAPVDTPVTSEPLVLGARLQKAIDKIRSPFRAFASDLSVLSQTRADIAPAFVKALDAFKAETELSMVDFVRLLDPAMPADRDSYRGHRSYQAALYLIQLQARATRPKGERRPKSATPLDGMARIIASLLPLIGADQVPRLWESVTRELHWSERQVQALQGRVKDATALAVLRPLRGQGGAIPQLRIATVRSVDTEDAEDTEDTSAPRTGTHG